MGYPGPFLFVFVLFKHVLQIKTVRFRGIRTRIVVEKSKQAGKLTARPTPQQNLALSYLCHLTVRSDVCRCPMRHALNVHHFLAAVDLRRLRSENLKDKQRPFWKAAQFLGKGLLLPSLNKQSSNAFL